MESTLLMILSKSFPNVLGKGGVSAGRERIKTLGLDAESTAIKLINIYQRSIEKI